MHVVRCTPREYGELFATPSHVFNTVDFNELNRHKCEDIHYLTICDDKGKVRLGVVLGQRGTMLKSPFSAPFGGIEERGSQSVEWYVGAIDALRRYAVGCGCGVVMSLPPALYDSHSVYSKQYCAMMTGGARTSYVDYNYHYNLERVGEFEHLCSRSARKNFAKASRYDWCFEVLDGCEADIERVYNIIKANRESHGYPLRMSLDDVKATSRIIKCTFMVLSHEGVDVAAVLAYDVADDISQVVYWGDVPGYSELRPMNKLAYETFCHFARCGRRMLDIGPSSSDGIPSLGLCDFKASLGCILTPKFTVEL